MRRYSRARHCKQGCHSFVVEVGAGPDEAPGPAPTGFSPEGEDLHRIFGDIELTCNEMGILGRIRAGQGDVKGGGCGASGPA
jgi:hypothetical protein